MPVPFPPPLAPAKAFSAQGPGAKKPLYSRVMRGGLFTGGRLCRAKSVSDARYSLNLLTAVFW